MAKRNNSEDSLGLSLKPCVILGWNHTTSVAIFGCVIDDAFVQCYDVSGAKFSFFIRVTRRIYGVEAKEK